MTTSSSELEKARKRLLKTYMALPDRSKGHRGPSHREAYFAFLQGAGFALLSMESITLETTVKEFNLKMREEALRRFPDFEEKSPEKKRDPDPYGMRKDD